MGKTYDEIAPDLASWLGEQRLFFVATAPLTGDGHVNLSPKGRQGTLRILDDRTVAYLDFGGSHAETIAHLRENGRITLMWCAFEGPPNIVRVHGRGEPVFRDDPRFAELAAGFGEADGPALRAIITADPEEWPVVTGEARAGFLQLWNEVKQERPEFTTIGVVNPPGMGVSGLRVALELLVGNQLDESQLQGEFGNTLYVPIPGVVDESNFQDVFEEYQDAPASYTLDGWISQEEAHTFMQ